MEKTVTWTSDGRAHATRVGLASICSLEQGIASLVAMV